MNKGGIEMASVFDVAKYILDSLGGMSTWKLQKLCYYSQAWAIAWTETPLFTERIEAWANGPVCPDLFQSHRGKFMVDSHSITVGDTANLTIDQKETIDKVIEYYGNWEPYELREQTHSEDPWKIARAGLPDGAPSTNEITPASMGEYYGKL